MAFSRDPSHWLGGFSPLPLPLPLPLEEEEEEFILSCLVHMMLGGVELREFWDSPFLVLTSPNPGLEAATDYFSLFRCGPALLLLELCLELSRHTVAHALGYIYFHSTPQYYEP